MKAAKLITLLLSIVFPDFMTHIGESPPCRGLWEGEFLNVVPPDSNGGHTFFKKARKSVKNCPQNLKISSDFIPLVSGVHEKVSHT